MSDLNLDGPVGQWICKTCGVTLTRLTTSKPGQPVEQRWGHPAELFGKTDHEVEAIPYDEALLTSVCDFCNDKVPLDERSFLPVANFELGLQFEMSDGTTELYMHRNRGGYNTCRRCAVFIRANDWEGLGRRYLKLHNKVDLGPLQVIWEETRNHITGPLREWQPGDHVVEGD